MPFIKLNQPKYLSQGQYLIADTDPDSTYFNVTEVPDILHGGKNLFMIKGNQSLLAPSSTIEIEVTDLNGRSIYHENANYIEPGTKRRAVAIYVYEHTPQGGGVITITGTAQKRPNGKSVSLELQKTPNVMWQKKINVIPQNENTTRVIMDKTPVVQIKELVKNYLVPSGGLTSGTTTISELDGNGFISFTNGAGGWDLSYLSTTASFFESGMEGSQIVWSNLSVASQSNPEVGSANQDDPNCPSVVNFLSNAYGQEEVFSTVITYVESDTKAYVLNRYETAFHIEYTGNCYGVDYAGTTEIFQNIFPTGFGPIHNSAGGAENYQFNYQSAITWTSQTENSQSFAKIDIAELDPICGDIKRLAIYKKSQGIQQWDYLADIILENKELLARDDSQGLNQNLGNFSTTAIVNTYWTGSFAGFSGTAPSTLPVIVPDASLFINGVLISGSEALIDASTPATRADAYLEYKMKPSADWNGDGVNTSGVALKVNTSYILSMKLAGQAVNDGVNKPVIKVFASGSAIDLPSEDSTMRKFATLQANSQYTGDQQGSPIGILDESTLNYHFDVSTAGEMAVIFRIVSGKWWISDVSIKPASQTGFTPNHTSVEIPVNQITQQNDIVDFKFELYDNLDNLVHTEVTQSLAWAGSNVYINGDNNYLGAGILMDAGPADD